MSLEDQIPRKPNAFCRNSRVMPRDCCTLSPQNSCLRKLDFDHFPSGKTPKYVNNLINCERKQNKNNILLLSIRLFWSMHVFFLFF